MNLLRRNHRPIQLAIYGAVALALAGAAIQAQTKPGDDRPAKNATRDPRPDAEQVLEKTLRQRRPPQAIPPIQVPIVEADAGAPPRSKMDARVLGVAPDMPQPKLRREGEFIGLRRGRAVRGPDATQVMFVFESDSKDAPETPMFIMPCQTLENMERLVAERGDRVVFLLSGQVFTYRGSNYLLPSVMKLAVDKGNLGR